MFLGPSLPLSEARSILEADYRPPVRRGDIEALLADPPPAIGIIDGEFFQSMSISPKEILRAIESGLPVLGASSMGALRAVELEPYGMIGVGQVFELYRSGKVIADDEVALTFSPGDYRPVSEAMVNMRVALEEAVAAGVITSRTRLRLLSLVRSTYFPERSWEGLWQQAAVRLPSLRREPLRHFLEERRTDVKSSDARELLLRLGRIGATSSRA